MQGAMNASPTDVFSRADAVEKGETSRLMAFMGAVAVADVVKTTLGPKGMDKILQSGDPSGQTSVVVTNDGATILKSLHIDNPAARILVDISMTQDAEVGDGTTSVVVLAGELLREGDRLTQMKIHPQTIVRGWRKALKVAMGALEGHSQDNGKDPKAFREDLINIAKTTLGSKVVQSDLDKFANMCVDAVLRLKGGNIEQIKIIRAKGGQLKDSFLDPGFILPKSFGVGQSKVIENPKIMVANTPMDTDKIKIFGARVRVNAISEVAKIEKAEKAKMRKKVEKILAHKPDVFINRQLIYNYPEQIFTDAGVISIEHADFEGVEHLANVLGAEIASTFDGKIQLGTCERLEEVLIGEDKFLRFSGVKKGEACSIVLRGSPAQIQGEAERSIHDALCVLTTTVKDTRTVLGGGCSEMIMACAVDNLAKLTAGKEALAVEAFANALRQIPTILANNGGYDSSELVTQLRAAHNSGKSTFGLDMNNGRIACLREMNIVESFRSKAQSLTSAHEAAEMILRVDDTIRAMPRPRADPNEHRH